MSVLKKILDVFRKETAEALSKKATVEQPTVVPEETVTKAAEGIQTKELDAADNDEA